MHHVRSWTTLAYGEKPIQLVLQAFAAASEVRCLPLLASVQLICLRIGGPAISHADVDLFEASVATSVMFYDAIWLLRQMR